LVYAPFFPEVAYGDRLCLNCRLDEPEPFAGFAYDRYLARHDIYVVCFYPEIREQEPGFGHPVWTGLFQVKKHLREKLERGLEEPAASLAKAMVLGDKSAIAEHERELFARAGLSHVIAISGMHIGTISAIIMFILFGAGFTRKQAFYWAAAALIIYVFLIGFPASAVRASIMGLFVLLAMHCGRLNRLGYALALAAAFMLLFNPRLLRDDIGFQLSFLAVLGIGWFYSPVSAALKRLKMPPLYGTRIILAVTIAAQILTVPLALYYFGIISFVSPLANVLVVSLLPALLFLVFMALFLSWLLPGLAWAWFMPAWAVLAYAQKTASFLVSLPGAYYETEIGREWLWVYYGTAVLTAVLLRKYRLSVPGF
jgi:competence protein ComEC